MLLLALSLGAGIVLGCLLRGRLRAFGQLRLRAFRCLAVALGGQLVLPIVPAAVRFPVLLLSYSLAGAWLVLNARGRPVALRWGLLLAAAGWFFNLLPIAANGDMPVSANAMRQVAHRSDNRWHVNLDKHRIVSGEARLRWLGDVIPVRPLESVVSVGDLFLALGITLTVAAIMTQPDAPSAR